MNGRSSIWQQEDLECVGFEQQFSASAGQNRELLLECGCYQCNAEELAYVYMHPPIEWEIVLGIQKVKLESYSINW